jgi:hypothetical protein
MSVLGSNYDMPAQMGHVRSNPDSGSDPALSPKAARVSPMLRFVVRGGEYRRIKRRWQAALGRLNGNKTRGGFLGAPPSGATCMLDGRCLRRR